MSAPTTEPVDAATLQRVVEQATPKQRRYLVEMLLPTVAEEERFLPRLVHNSKGEPVGIVFPGFHSKAIEPPQLTAEERAELQHRLANLDDTISHEEMLKRLGLADLRTPVTALQAAPPGSTRASRRPC